MAPDLMEADDCCPLCMEDLDITDRNFRPCKCGYQICLFCYRHIKDDLNGLCPACRTPYDDSNVTFVAPDPQEMKKLAAEKKAKEAKEKKEQAAREAKEKREAEMKSRQEAQVQARAAAAASAVSGQSHGCGMVGGNAGSSTSPASVPLGHGVGGPNAAVSRQPPRPTAVPTMVNRPAPPLPQRAVISVTGLSPRIAKEEIMRRQEYFGQYGKIMRVVLNTPSNTPGPPSFSCQITYSSREEAEQAILAVDGVHLDGRKLKAMHTPTPVAPQAPVAPLPGQLAGSRMPSVSSDSDLPMSDHSAQASAVANAATSVREAASRDAALARNEPPALVGSRSAVGGPVGPVGSTAAVGSRETAAVARPMGLRAPAQQQDRVAPLDDRVAPPPQHGDLGKSGGWMPTALGDMAPAVGTIGSGAAIAASGGPSALLESSAVSLLGVAGVNGGSGPPGALASLGADLGPPLNLGSDLDPVLLGSGFEALLSGLAEDNDNSEDMPKNSRFARFFKMEDGDEADDAGAPSALRELGGVPLGPGPPKGAIPTQQQPAAGAAASKHEDWQQGFRALLPNVNISFSGSGASGLGALSLGGLDSIAGFSNGSNGAGSRLGAFEGVGMVGQSDATTLATSGSTLDGLGGHMTPGADLLAQLASGGNISSLAGLGGAPLSSAPLPLSSQLQNLLQGTGSDTGIPSSSDVGASLHSLFGGAGSGNGLIPGWASAEVLPGRDDTDPIAALAAAANLSVGKGGNKKEPIGMAAANRNDKPKKRGGSGNRGGKVEMKPSQK